MSWSVAGTVVFALSQLAVFVVIARMTSPVEVGQFGLAMALAIPVYMLSSLGLRVGRATETAARYELGDYVAVRILGTGLALVALFIMGGIVATDMPTFAIIALVAIAKASESVSDLAYGVFQRHERLRHFAVSMLIRGPVMLALFAVILGATGELWIALLGQVVVWFLVAFAVDRPVAARLEGVAFRPDFDRTRLMRLVQESVPLGVGAATGALHNQAPRLAIGSFLGLETLGLYQIAAFPLQALQMMAAIGNAIVARLARLRVSNYGAFLRLTFVVAIAAGSLGLAAWGVVWLIADWLIAAVFGVEYLPAATAFVIVTGAMAARMVAIVLQFGILAERRFRAFRTVQTAVLLVTIAALLATVPGGSVERVALGLLIVCAFHALFAGGVLVAGGGSPRQKLNDRVPKPQVEQHNPDVNRCTF